MSRWSLFLVLLSAVAGLRAESPLSETDLRRDATVAAVEKVLPSVANVSTETMVQVQDPFDQMLRQFFGRYRRPEAREQYSLGSGVVVDEDGYILTNDHVVRRADKIEVTIGTNSYSARIIAQNGSTDLALLKITDAHPSGRFRAIRFARDDDLYIGETVLAVGNPFGLGGSVSRGILSSKNRRPDSDNGPLEVEDWLQTDAAINPGNSGGPLIDLRGELIGLNVAIYREGEAQGIGFAIPIKRITEALSEMFTPEGVQGVWFGARIRSNAGVPIVSSVQADSPADRAGVKSGDLIFMVDRKTPRNFIEATEMILRHTEGDLMLTLQRAGGRREATVRLRPLAEVLDRSLGLTLSPQELPPDLATRLKLGRTAVLEVSEIDADGPAARANLRRGYLVLGIDGKSVASVAGAAMAVAGKKRGDKSVLEVLVQRPRGSFIEWLTDQIVVKTR